MMTLSWNGMASRPVLSTSRRLIQAAQWCGALPMAVGSVIMLGWWQSGSLVLPLLGALNVVLGLALFGIGLGLLYGAYQYAGRRYLPGMGIALALLLGNFPLAAGYGALAGVLEEHRLQASACVEEPADGNAEPTGLADARRRPCS